MLEDGESNGWLKMRCTALLWVGALLIWLAPCTYAAPDMAGLEARIQTRLVINDLLVFAYHNNSDIVEAKAAWRAAVESYRIVTGYPDPQLMTTYFPEPIETRLGPQDWSLTISQKIPFPGKISGAAEIAAIEAGIAMLKLDGVVRDTMLMVRESFWELYYIRNAKFTARKNMDLLSHLRKVAETAHADERAMFIDIVKTQSQYGQLRYDLLLLEDLEQTELTRLNSLLNREPAAVVGQLVQEGAVPVKYSPKELYGLAESYHEEILIADMQVRKAKAYTALTRIENMPDFNVGLFYSAIGDPDVPNPPDDAGRDAIGVRAGISIPLWFGKNSGRVSRAKAQASGAAARKISRMNKVRTQIRTVFFKMQNAWRLMVMYENELLPGAAESLSMAEMWFRDGEGSLSDFIEAQSLWYNFQLARTRAEADYGKYYARLTRLVGRSLDQEKGDEASHIDSYDKEGG